MRKYEAIIILNPNLSSKVDNFLKDFEKLLKDFSNKNFTFFNTNAHELFIENNKHIINLF